MIIMIDVKDLFIKDYVNKEVSISGWIRNHRKQKEFGFIDFNDGTYFKNLQIVYDNTLKDFLEIQKLHIGSAITVKGKIIKSEGSGQDIEMKLISYVLEGDCPEDYPIQPKRHTKEFLREQAYLRMRTNLFGAVFRVRSIAAYAIHKYFQDNGYVYFHAPLITAADAEGAERNGGPEAEAGIHCPAGPGIVGQGHDRCAVGFPIQLGNLHARSKAQIWVLHTARALGREIHREDRSGSGQKKRNADRKKHLAGAGSPSDQKASFLDQPVGKTSGWIQWLQPD